ncbi:MAG: TRAP transporter small permease [Rhodospirillales bacterium]
MTLRPFRNLAIRLDRAAALLATAGGGIAACALVLMTAHVVIEVVLRGAFSTSTFALDEYVGYGTAAMTFLGAGYALQEGALIRVNILLGRLDRDSRSRRVLEVFAVVMTIAVMALLNWYFLVSVLRNFSRGTVSETVAATPLWIPEAAVTAGITILLLRLCAYLLVVATGGPVIEDGEGDEAGDDVNRGALSMGNQN